MTFTGLSSCFRPKASDSVHIAFNPAYSSGSPMPHSGHNIGYPQSTVKQRRHGAYCGSPHFHDISSISLLDEILANIHKLVDRRYIMGLEAYSKTTVVDNVTKVVAAHHNDQEDQLVALTNHALALQSLMVQGVLFGTVAAGVAAEKPVFVAPYACRLGSLHLVNGATLAANGTNYTRLELVNKGASGSGSTVLATFDGSTESFTAFDAIIKSVGTVDLAAGDVLTLKKTDFSAGALVSDLLVEVGFKPVP